MEGRKSGIEGERKEWKGKGRKGGKKDKVPYQHFFFPLPARTTV